MSINSSCLCLLLLLHTLALQEIKIPYVHEHTWCCAHAGSCLGQTSAFLAVSAFTVVQDKLHLQNHLAYAAMHS